LYKALSGYLDTLSVAEYDLLSSSNDGEKIDYAFNMIAILQDWQRPTPLLKVF
jgi:hypothetical protein